MSCQHRSVIMTLDLGLTVTDDPRNSILLLVGTNIGHISLWNLYNENRVFLKTFHVSSALPMWGQETLRNSYALPINRVKWNSSGSQIAVAFSKNLLQVYSYHGGQDIRAMFEAVAHIGSVNDIAFCSPNFLVTCGEDRGIRVYNAATGDRLHKLYGHKACVHSVCPRLEENKLFLISMATDGRIMAWYDAMNSIIEYQARVQYSSTSTSMAYSDDGTRLFASGTKENSKPYIIELDKSNGAVKRTYNGIGYPEFKKLKFEIIRNRLIAASVDNVIKIWDFNNVNLLRTIDVEGGLSANPCLRSDKEGMLLAVTTSNNGIKILGNNRGAVLLRRMSLDLHLSL